MTKTRSTAANFMLAVALFGVAIFAPPALAANVLAGAFGLFVLNAGTPAASPVLVAQEQAKPAPQIEHPKVIRVRGGIVVFEQRGQQVVSRFYPA